MARAARKQPARTRAKPAKARKPRAKKASAKAAKPSARKTKRASSGKAQAHAREPRGPSSRSFWSGTLSFGLVSLPVELYPATRAQGTRTRLLAQDGTPLQQRWICPEEDRELSAEEIVRADEVEGHGFVPLSEEELETVEPRRTRDIELSSFVEMAEIEPVLFERSWVLTPGSPQTKPYRLLAEVLEQSGRAGIARFVLRRRERLVAIVAENGVLWGHSLRFAEELRDVSELDFEPPEPAEKAVESFAKAIRKLAAKSVDPALLADEDQAALEALVERKRARNEDVVEAPAGEEAATEEATDEPAAAPPDLFEEIRRRMRGEGGRPGARRKRRAKR